MLEAGFFVLLESVGPREPHATRRRGGLSEVGYYSALVLRKWYMQHGTIRGRKFLNFMIHES